MVAPAPAILLPPDYCYVALVAAAYTALNWWMAVQVAKARQKYKVFYPNLYALESENKDAKLFNCIQRGHQNSLEFLPAFYANLMLGGLQHPRIASSLGVLYTLARFSYFHGYSTGIPDNRFQLLGRLIFPTIFGIILCTASLAVHLFIQGTLLPYL